MKKIFILLLSFTLFLMPCIFSQNVGIGTTTPQGKLNIKGNADTSQLVIDANATQSNLRPLIRLRDAAGFDLLHIHSDYQTNTFIGLDAGRNNNVTASGTENTFIGSQSGYKNFSGFNNTGTGYKSLFANTSGVQNTAMGMQALASNTTGKNNTAVGNAALLFNNNGISNTAIGGNALIRNTTASTNTAIGANALYFQNFSNNGVAWTSDNTAVGYEALFFNNPTSTSNGISNTAVGSYALTSNTTGYENTAVGVAALYTNDDGHQNTAIGRQAMFFNKYGDLNVALGYKALRNNVTGVGNIAIGNNALENNLGGLYNTVIGSGAYNENINANNNTVIGRDAHALGSNCIAIGQNCYNSGNNSAVIGNATVTITGGYSIWSVFSDGRFKTNIDEEVKGLDFIMRLRPVTYHMDVKGLYNFWGVSPYGKQDSSNNKMRGAMKTETDKSIYEKESIRMSGFIAQEVEKAALQSGYDFDGVIKPAHDKDHYRLAYGEFVVPLVKAMQEQQQIIEGQQKQIDDLKDQNKKILAAIDQLVQKQKSLIGL